MGDIMHISRREQAVQGFPVNRSYTKAEADKKFGSGAVTSVFTRTGAVVAVSGDYNTSLVTENTNLYFTNARAIASTLTGYTSGAGTISATDTILGAIQKLNGNVAAISGSSVSSVFGRSGAVVAVANDYSALAQNWTATQTFSNATASAYFTGGFVGIGNTNARTLLEVTGHISFGQYSDNLVSKFIGVANGNAPLSGLEIENTTLGGNYSQKIHLLSHAFGASNGRRLTVTEVGWIGINNQNPSFNFDVTGQGRFIYSSTTPLLIQSTGSTAVYAQFTNVNTKTAFFGLRDDNYMFLQGPAGGSGARIETFGGTLSSIQADTFSTYDSVNPPSGGAIFAGNVGIGQSSSPTAKLHLAAGTATAGTAPIKFTAGTLETTPRDGVVEYNGSHYYGTVGTTRLQFDQQFLKLAPTETPNGSLKIFTFSTAVSQPNFVVSDGAMTQAVSKTGTVNWTWSSGAKQATMSIPPQDDIVAIQ